MGSTVVEEKQETGILEQPIKVVMTQPKFLVLADSTRAATALVSGYGQQARVAPSHALYVFFTRSETPTIKAIFRRLTPGIMLDPGALEGGVQTPSVYFLRMQQTYRRGIASINSYSQGKYQKDFAALTSDQQDGILADMQRGSATGFLGLSPQQFFRLLVQHVREGTFCDPVYDGNRDMVGWSTGLLAARPAARWQNTCK